MHLQKMDKNKHDSFKVSELIYEADAETFDFFFGNKRNASEKLWRLVGVGDNHLGYQQIYLVTNDDQEIVGIMVYSSGEKIGKINELKVIFGNFNFLDSLRFIMIEIIDSLFLSKLNEDDFYYAIVAVDENSRGQGIGSFILEGGIKLARKMGCRRAVLDVDIENEGALRLYERFGFRKFKEKSISLLGWKKGAFNMEYLL
ncbi:GNAT family N-acetyltransferase [Methanobacterium subterraneum]|uniref:GNAT family N-acetyltransferase n=1 Tax=Methanobacterium subterraneum TaxID=59277 RepID=A0A2H4VBH1_9EURY|nr:GNAT family N-acetyltransferase [Methanobacterium subterraneum]AUB55431.1 GNAT family N-acetyltransferase [Methanobacterium subterraneum]